MIADNVAPTTLESYGLALGDVVTVTLLVRAGMGSTGPVAITGTVSNATGYVLIIDQRDGAVISRIPWRSIASIDTAGQPHPAT